MENNNKKIVLTGGTGHIGSVIALLLGPSRCVLFTRPTSSPPDELKDFETVVVDLTNKEEVEKACEGREGIIHMACSLSPEETLEFREEVEINGALGNLLDAAASHSIPLVYASSIAARWSSPPSAMINHLPSPSTNFDNPLYPMGTYSRSKQMGEELISKKIAENPSLRACSVLPAAVYGCSPRVGVWNNFVSATLTNPPPSTPSPFSTLFCPAVWVGDVAEVFVKALEKGEKKGEAYPCFGGDLETPRVGEWAKVMKKGMVGGEEEEGEKVEGGWKIENSITEGLGIKFKTMEEVMVEYKGYLEEKGLLGEKKAE